MLFLKIYLLFGLVFHKAVWEILKQQSSEKPVESKSPALMVVKAIKIGILLGLIVQIWLPDVFPITENAWPVRLAGIIIYTTGLLTAIIARFQLGDNWANIETGQVLQNQKVVAKGIYAFIRHPIYTGDLLLLLGFELALNSWLVLGILLLAPAVMLKASKEEQMLARELPGYHTYCTQTKRFIPFVI